MRSIEKETLKRLTRVMLADIKKLKDLGFTVDWGYYLENGNPVSQDLIKGRVASKEPANYRIKITVCAIRKLEEDVYPPAFLGLTKKNPVDSPNLKFARLVSFQRAFSDLKKKSPYVNCLLHN